MECKLHYDVKYSQKNFYVTNLGIGAFLENFKIYTAS